MKSKKKDKIKRKSKLITRKKCRGKNCKGDKIKCNKHISGGKRYSRKKVKGNKKSKKRVSQKKIQKGSGMQQKLVNSEIFGTNPPAVYYYRDNTFGFNCPVCRNGEFKIKTSKLSTGKRITEFFFGDASEVFLEKKIKVFICNNCGHISMFTNKIDMEYYNRADSKKNKSRYRRGFMGRKIRSKRSKISNNNNSN